MCHRFDIGLFFQTLYDVYDPKIYTLPIEKFPDEEKNYVDVDIIEYVVYIQY